MSKLNKIASTSDLMNIDIRFNGKKIKFNLFEELQIIETRLNSDLKTHATSYAFLTQLLSYLERETSSLEADQKRTWAKLYVQYKKGTGENGRARPDELCKAMADRNPVYQKALRKAIDVKFQKSLIARAVSAFEERKDLIQSLSANLRQENK